MRRVGSRVYGSGKEDDIRLAEDVIDIVKEEADNLNICIAEMKKSAKVIERLMVEIEDMKESYGDVAKSSFFDLLLDLRSIKDSVGSAEFSIDRSVNDMIRSVERDVNYLVDDIKKA